MEKGGKIKGSDVVHTVQYWDDAMAKLSEVWQSQKNAIYNSDENEENKAFLLKECNFLNGFYYQQMARQRLWARHLEISPYEIANRNAKAK